MNIVAPKGQVWVCAACGKQSKDKYGEQKISAGWDESCMLHAVLCYEKTEPDESYLGLRRHIAVEPQP